MPTTESPPLGHLLIKEGLVTPVQLQEALRAQRGLKMHRPIGQILVDQSVITQRQLNLILDLYDKRPKLGNVLVRTGAISQDQLAAALAEQKKSGLPLGETLLRLGYLTEDQFRDALCTQLNIPLVDLDAVTPDRELARLINKAYARRHLVVPVSRSGSALTLAMDDPTDHAVVEELQLSSGFSIAVVTASRAAIRRAFARLYDDEPPAEVAGADRVDVLTEEPEGQGRSRYVDDQQTRRADALVRQILNLAIDRRASDIHLETLAGGMHVRFRVDGVLQELSLGVAGDAIARSHREIISRVKILGRLDIAERRRPQDGSFRARLERGGQGVTLDFRVSIVPGYYGESVVIRILDRRNAPRSIEQLGFAKAITERLHEQLRRTTGMFLVTGPTGSGKSSTLYAALMTVYRPEIRILTAEDPIEYVYEHFSQSEVDEKIGNTFARYLRAFLRHDPEVIMVGEIRDEETAEMAFRAAQTGHLLLSTLHTNSAIASVTRLMDLEVDANLVTSSLLGVLAQRLVREVCPECREEYEPPAELIREFFEAPRPELAFYRGRGCTHCNFTGYKGRMAVGELWIPSERDALLITKRACLDEIRESAEASTYPMGEDAWEKLRQGRTNLEELIRTLPYYAIYRIRRIAAGALTAA